MGRLAFLALLTVAGTAVAGDLWPPLRSPRVRRILYGAGLFSIAAWGLPVLLGQGMHASLPVVGGPMKIAGSVWFVTASIVTMVGAPFLLLRGTARRVARWWAEDEAPANPSRRQFLGNAGKAIPVAAAATSVVGVVNGSLPFQLKEQTVSIRGLPKALDGFRIGQLTDVHVGAFVSPANVQKAVEVLDSRGVHLQVMTGDLIDDLDSLAETFDALGSCRAPHGMVAVYGNHEHWRGISTIRKQYERLTAEGKRVKLLVDAAHEVVHEGERLRIVGVDYPFFAPGRDTAMRRSADRAFSGASPGDTLLCLSHHPAFFPFASEKGARLTLSGHTHGGQVALLGIPLFSFVFKYNLGRYRDGENHLYVSGGTGHWMPFRIGIPAEITVLTLRSA